MTNNTAFMEISDLSCASCVGRAERAVQAVSGLNSVSINLSNHMANVDLGTAATSDVVTALSDAGYPARTSDATFSIQNMSCASCVGRVEKSLAINPAIVNASVNLASQTAQITWISAMLEPKDVAALITSSGYPAEPLRASHTVSQADRQDAEARDLKRDTLLAAAATLPVFALEMSSHFIPGMRTFIDDTLGQTNSWILQFFLVTLLMIGPGRRFFTSGIPAILRRAPDMNALVVLGTGAAWLFSTVSLFAPSMLPEGTASVYFEAAAVIITLLLLGRYFEARAKGKTGAAISSLLSLRPSTARTKRGGVWLDISIDDIQRGDHIQIRPGERIAIDGSVLDGTSFVDESMITGEPIAVEKTIGAKVIGGTINTTGALTITTTAVGGDTVLSGIIKMVQDAQGAKLPIQALADKIVQWFVPAVLVIALLTVITWLGTGPDPALGLALVAAVSVLIVACPCAMGLATPTSIMVGTGRAAELGVLFRKGDALQSLSRASVVAFDKTGTLTMGTPQVSSVHTLEADQGSILRKVAAVEALSEHPLASAIVKAHTGDVPKVKAFRSVTGMGASGVVEGTQVLVGNARYLVSEGVDIDTFNPQADTLMVNAETPVFVAFDGKAVAVLGISDQIKPSAQAVISRLKALDIKVAMITGDATSTANAIAKTLGIDTVCAEVLPEGKVAALDDIASERDVLVFVGDGINDAPALATADVGIALGTGTDVAVETADVVLMSGDLGGVLKALEVSRATLRNIRQNLFWAFAYNAALIPVAAGLLYPLWGVLLSPMLAAGAMALSSVFVVTNALRLRWVGR